MCSVAHRPSRVRVAVHHPLQGRLEERCSLWLRRLALGDVVQHGHGVAPLLVRRVPLDRGVQRRPECPDVGTRAGVVAPGQLRGEVARRAGEEAGLGQGWVTVSARDPEVADLRHPVLADQHVAGLHVAVHRAGGMCGLQPGSHLRADVGDGAWIQGTVLLDDLGERPSRHVLHHQPDVARLLDDVEDGDHVAVAQASRGAGLAKRSCGVGHRLAGQQADLLDGDVPVQGLVTAEPHGPHAALADRRVHSVSAADQLRLHRFLSLVARERLRGNVPSLESRTPG